MNGWQENDFLEKLLPSRRAKLDANRPACPDAATLIAVAEGDTNDWLNEAVAGHLQHWSRIIDFKFAKLACECNMLLA